MLLRILCKPKPTKSPFDMQTSYYSSHDLLVFKPLVFTQTYTKTKKLEL